MDTLTGNDKSIQVHVREQPGLAWAERYTPSIKEVFPEKSLGGRLDDGSTALIRNAIHPPFEQARDGI